MTSLDNGQLQVGHSHSAVSELCCGWQQQFTVQLQMTICALPLELLVCPAIMTFGQHKAKHKQTAEEDLHNFRASNDNNNLEGTVATIGQYL